MSFDGISEKEHQDLTSKGVTSQHLIVCDVQLAEPSQHGKTGANGEETVSGQP